MSASFCLSSRSTSDSCAHCTRAYFQGIFQRIDLEMEMVEITGDYIMLILLFIKINSMN